MESYGPPELGITMVQTYGYVEIEYAAVRKSAALFDWPFRGTIEITGADRHAFLGRMLTQELKNWPMHTARRSFWLNRKGRIDADLRLINLPDRVIADVDALAATRAVETLSSYAVMDDVAIVDITTTMHRLGLHGPASARLLSLCVPPADAPAALSLERGVALPTSIAGCSVIVDRWDATGEIGLELWCAAADAQAIYTELLVRGTPENAKPIVRPAGWAAFNIARIEAGTPFYNLDFGPDTLPAETGLLNDRVSFTKGCYLGQEIVARLHALGHPKRVLVGLDIESVIAEGPEAFPRQPETGSLIYAAETSAALAASAQPVGAVTSATLSPMLGNKPVAMAMVKWASSPAGTPLMVDCQATLTPAKVHSALNMLTR